MSCFSGSKLSPEQQKERDKSKAFDQEIKQESTVQKRHYKLLLLGTGDSGKSTFAKQMSLIHNKGGLSDQYIETFIPTLRDNALSGMQQLLKFFSENNNALEKWPEDLKKQAEAVSGETELTPTAASTITAIWKNKEFQALVMESGEDAQLQGGVSGVKYYFENSERFAAKDFKPTKEDLLKARRKTTGIVETQFTVSSNQFTMVDVGGQRSERKKWLHCFGSVSSVIFLTAINEYDMVLEEDSKTNRLVESLKLWKALTSSQFFKKTPFVLFLNKSDLFGEKIRKSPLVDIFSDYEAFANEPANSQMNDYDKGWHYIKSQYSIHFAGTSFYPHLTCALDSEQCQKVFLAIQDTLFKEAFAVSEFK